MGFARYVPPSTEKEKVEEVLQSFRFHRDRGRKLVTLEKLSSSLKRWPAQPELVQFAKLWLEEVRSESLRLSSSKATEMSDVTYENDALGALLNELIVAHGGRSAWPYMQPDPG